MECSIKHLFGTFLFMLFVLTKADTDSKAVSFVPSRYELHIVTKPEHFKESSEPLRFTGTVIIDFERVGTLPQDADFKIILNASPNTTVQSIELKENVVNGTVISTSHKLINDSLVITCSKSYTAVEKFKLTVNYENPFGNDMTGFYRSSYKEGSATRYLLTTQFEPIFARNAFPCFDQPDLKAKFKILITVPKDVTTVLSNTKEVNHTGTDSVQYVFEETPEVMSTYLVAFTASNLKSTDKVEIGKNKIILKTYGREEIINKGHAELAQTFGKEAVEKLTEYLDEPYTFGKIDQVGIPDFSAGAMENWGHISFREKSLFYDKKSNSISTKQSNVLTITHELVHQWFGNLVTLKSWDYIWLNEAFANYIEYIIASQFKESKEWDLLKQMVVNEIHLRAFETDGLLSSKPLNNKIENEGLIFSSFNDIPYSKGAAVLRMWNYALGDEKFRSALSNYIRERRGKASTPEELFPYFKAQGLTESNFKSWTDQPGYPVVELKKINETVCNLTQHRFLWEKSDSDSLWSIPISFSWFNSTDFIPAPKRYLDKKSEIVRNVGEWVIVNSHQAGYYRVNYDVENWRALTEALLAANYSKIPELNRAQIVNDVLSLARSLQKEYVDYSTALNLTSFLKNEKSFVVWKTALNAFEFLETKLYNENFYDKFKTHVLELIKPHFKGLNSSLSHVETLKNVEISRWACALGLDSCVKEAEALFSQSKYSSFPDTQEIVLCTVVKTSQENWNKVFDKYKQETDSALKVMYISALGCSANEALMQEFLMKTLDENSGIRKQDLMFVLSAVYNGNLKNVETAFKFVIQNYEKIAKTYGGINPIGRALVGIAKKLKTEEQYKRLKDLTEKIKNTPNGSAALDSINNALNIARSNINWVQQRLGQVRTFFNAGSLMSYSFALILMCLVSLFKFN